jgi:RNA polymerase sigma-70 factor (ECF subfamily)
MSEFASAIQDLRPTLHRYCARLMGSVIDGEDVVQDVLAKALVAAPALEAAALKPWLFRVAHNRALDLLRARNVRAADSIDDHDDLVDLSATDPAEAMMRTEAVRTAVSRFSELPLTQRAVVILKDVLDESLAEIADLLGLSVDGVKGHLARGRAALKAINTRTEPAAARSSSDDVARYVEMFNRRDWNGLRALLAADVRLKQSDYPVRTEDANLFFTFYAKSPPRRVAAAWLDGREVIAVYDTSAEEPSHFMWLEWRDGQISFIRDYRYVPYVVTEAELIEAGTR